MIDFLNMDCLEYMKNIPDNFFDLAIVDPEYGIGEHGGKNRTRKKHKRSVIHENKNWDNKIPDQEYFSELKRVSKNQIIWGANYFTNRLHIFPATMGWIYWDKLIGGDFSDGELAYTSFQRALKKYTKSIERSRGKYELQRIHPTQKPIQLYRWLLQNYAKPNDKILDTHGGSMSHAIACDMEGFDLVIIEKDKEYFDAAVKRFNQYKSQVNIEFP